MFFQLCPCQVYFCLLPCWPFLYLFVLKHLGKKIWAGVSEEEWNVCRGDEEGLAGLPSMPRNKTDFGDLQKLKTLQFIFLRDHGECRVGVTGDFFCACHLWWKGDAPDHDERTSFFSF